MKIEKYIRVTILVFEVQTLTKSRKNVHYFKVIMSLNCYVIFIHSHYTAHKLKILLEALPNNKKRQNYFSRLIKLFFNIKNFENLIHNFFQNY